MDTVKRIFISYSWDSDQHIKWVEKLANAIEVHEDVHVLWDGYDLDSCVDKNLFMEKSVTESDFTIIISTDKYCQKANNRCGGVGIETYLNTARHWEEMLNNKKTNSVVVLRDKNSTPNYLKGHLYIDFSEDAMFEESLSQLFNCFQSKSRSTRPKKNSKKIIAKNIYQLTKAEDIISISAKNRRAVIPLLEGTDFSGDNRIKFELWETNTPAVNHILALHNNINIQQTLSKASKLIISKNISIKTLIILRPKEKKEGSDSIDKYFEEIKEGSFEGIRLIETTYKDYVWEYCIDRDFKDVSAPDIIEFYTTQELEDYTKTYNSAIEHLNKEISNKSEFSAHLVVGSGGIGKTSLCLSLVNKLINDLSSESLTILIRSEDIRKYLEENKLSSNKIESIFDIYELQAKYLKQSNILDKKTFELSIVSGSIIIIIDGLDELTSIFRGKFDIRMFLQSISDLHHELGTSRILLTSRDESLVTESDLDSWNIQKYELLGFKNNNCEKYLKKRFQGYDNIEEIASSIMKQVEKSLLIGNDRIVPFFVDVMASIVEENIDDDPTNISFSVVSNATPYPSLNDLVDHVIFSIFEREKTRHKFHVETKDMVGLFCILNSECGESWSVPSVKRTLKLLYDQNGIELFKNIKQNPLLVRSREILNFKYDFLHSYFNSLYLFDCFNRKSVEPEFIDLLARVSTNSSEFKDMKKYFGCDIGVFIDFSKELLIEFRRKANKYTNEESLEHERYRSAIETIISLIQSLKSSNKEEFSRDIRYLYGVGSSGQIDALYMKGDLPAFDFSGLNVSNSKFRDYPKFLNSNFVDTQFMYCEFDRCHNDSFKSSKILSANIDRNTCVLGDLSKSLDMLSEVIVSGDRLVIEEAQKFFSSFYKGSSFRDNNKVHIRFSNHIKGLKVGAFNKLISNNYIRVSKEKDVDTFYCIEDLYKASVRKFINDGYKDSKIKQFLNFIV